MPTYSDTIFNILKMLSNFRNKTWLQLFFSYVFLLLYLVRGGHQLHTVCPDENHFPIWNYATVWQVAGWTRAGGKTADDATAGCLAALGLRHVACNSGSGFTSALHLQYRSQELAARRHPPCFTRRSVAATVSRHATPSRHLWLFVKRPLLLYASI